jgi:two-component system nitrogen regulation response regulator NtrX
MNSKIVVIDDESPIRKTLTGVLEDEGFQVFAAEEGVMGLRMVRENIPDAVLLDIWMPGMDGIEVLERLKEELPQIPVIIMSGHGTIETAVRATKIGAFDFIEKPISLDRLILLINNAIAYYRLLTENTYLKEKMSQNMELITKSPKIQKLFDEIKALSKSQMTVILLGEEGTGKSFLAKFIHANSENRKESFIELNCAIPGNNTHSVLMENISIARDGTLYLREFPRLTHESQNLLLKHMAETRLIFSASSDFSDEIKNGSLLSTFFYSINGVSVNIPSLKDRREDINEFIGYFTKLLSVRYLRELKFSDEALVILKKYQWPGNIKEIKNFVEHMLITSKTDIVTHKDLPDYILRNCQISTLEEELFHHNLLSQAKKLFEKEFIKLNLVETCGNVKKSAEILGLKESHLIKKIEHYLLQEYVR